MVMIMYNKNYTFSQDEYDVVLSKQSGALKAIREYHNLTKPEMAHLLEISERHYYGLESGESAPSCKTIFMMAKVFNVSIDELIYGSDRTSSPNTLKRTLINESDDLSTYGLLMLLGAINGIKEVESNYPKLADISGDYFQ